VFLVKRSDESTQRVLKRLSNPARRDRFLRELAVMRDMSAADVPVPPVLDTGEDGSGPPKPYFVMPYYERGSLQEAITDKRYLHDPQAGIAMLQDIARALDLMHACRWAHRDVKPANVLVDDTGKPLLADFGLALSVEETRNAPLTDSNEAVGSRLYIAPENEHGFNPDVDQRPADFYAFAKVAWELLAGRNPPAREAQSEHSRRLATITDTPELDRLDVLFEQLLSPDPRARLTDWEPVRGELSATVVALRGDADQTRSTPEHDLDAIARRYLGSEAYQRNQEQTAAVSARQDHYFALREAASEALREHQSELEAVSQAMRDFSLSVSTASRVFDISPVLDQHPPGRYGQPGWEGVPGARSSLGHQPIAGVEFGPDLRSYRLAPITRGYVELYAYIEDQRIWFIQVVTLSIPGEPRGSVLDIPPGETGFFNVTAEDVAGPFRLGLAGTVDAAREAAHKLAATSIDIFGRYMTIIATGQDPGSAESWTSDESEA
jgi:serine/threonine protein kinase